MSIMIYNRKTGKCWNQYFLQEVDPESYGWNKMCQSFFLVKIAQILWKVIVFFPGKGKGDKTLILKYLDRPMAEFFPHHCLFISISVIFRGKWEVKLGTKLLTLFTSLFHKNSNPSKNFQLIFLFARLLPLVKISVILDNN